jgi:hypothetical protein
LPAFFSSANEFQNNHEWGDQWNGEDLSIFSLDDTPLPLHASRDVHDPYQDASPQTKLYGSTASLDRASPSFSQSRSSEAIIQVVPSNLKESTSTPSISPSHTGTPAEIGTKPGFRAAEAYVRPSPIVTHGEVVSHGFDLRNATFDFALECESPTPEDAPTEIFLPEFHFPREGTDVSVSGGKWIISTDDADGVDVQKLRWWHGEGEQSMTVKGVKRRQGVAIGSEEEEGYLEQCQNGTCGIM